MDILFICPVFQPYCPVAATRPPAFAKYLLDQGHSLRVLAAHSTRYEPINVPPIDPDLITYVDMWLAQDVAGKIMRPFKRARGIQTSTAPTNAPSVPEAKVQAISPLKAWYYDAFDYAFNYPDSYMGWIKNAKKAGEALIESRKPDLIFSTAPPHSANVVASHLAKRFQLPWVCEYRDLWMDHPYHTPNAIRRFFETQLERRSIATVDQFVAVSAEAKGVLEAKTQKPCVLAYNGFEPSDFERSDAIEPLCETQLTMVYAGSIYPKTRDPSLLFEGLRKLGNARMGIDVRFYTENPGTVRDIAQRYGVEDCVSFHATRPYRDILRLEQAADILFLMRWDDPREDGVIPGKVFEYLGARRPILSTGRVEGEVADILKGRPETLLSRNVDKIVDQLRRWLDQRQKGRLPDVQHSGDAAYIRSSQFSKIDAMFSSLF